MKRILLPKLPSDSVTLQLSRKRVAESEVLDGVVFPRTLGVSVVVGFLFSDSVSSTKSFFISHS